MRKLTGWNVDSVVQEYCSYADNKIRDNDIQYIRNFDIAILAALQIVTRFDSGSRASDGRVASQIPGLPKMAKMLITTALVLLLWVFTAFGFRTD